MKKRKARGPHDDANAARLADLKVATAVIGDAPVRRLIWVVRFLKEDPRAWHSATRAAHGDCLVALGRGGFPDNLVGGIDLPAPLSAEEVETLHGELGATLRALVGSHPGRPFMVEIPTEGSTEGLVRLSDVGALPALFASSYGHARARTAIFQAVKNLVLQAGDQLLACPGCGAPFVKVGKQRFCEIKCAQRQRNERNAPKRRKGGAR